MILAKKEIPKEWRIHDIHTVGPVFYPLVQLTADRKYLRKKKSLEVPKTKMNLPHAERYVESRRMKWCGVCRLCANTGYRQTLCHFI